MTIFIKVIPPEEMAKELNQSVAEATSFTVMDTLQDGKVMTLDIPKLMNKVGEPFPTGMIMEVLKPQFSMLFKLLNEQDEGE
jgi:hypothetical protein